MKLKLVFISLMAMASTAMADVTAGPDLGDVYCDLAVISATGDIDGEAMTMKMERNPEDAGAVMSIGTMSYDGEAYGRIRAQGSNAIVSLYIGEKETAITRLPILSLAGQTIPAKVGGVEYQIECSPKN